MKPVRCDTKEGYFWLGIPEDYKELFLDFRNQAASSKAAANLLLREREILRDKVRDLNKAVNVLQKRIKKIERRTEEHCPEKKEKWVDRFPNDSGSPFLNMMDDMNIELPKKDKEEKDEN